VVENGYRRAWVRARRAVRDDVVVLP